MKFDTQPAPHTVSDNRVASVMFRVVIALIPVIAVHLYYFGWGLLIQIIVATAASLAAEALALKLRQLPIRTYLLDGSATVTALLIAISLPPLAPWWLAATGGAFAILLAKHAYGGLGYNTFNPAMIGYVVLLVSFPIQMTYWPHASGMEGATMTLWQTVQTIATGSPPAELTWDAITGPTPLMALRTGLEVGETIQETRAAPIFSALGGRGWDWWALASIAGGIFMLATRTTRWQIPVSMLASFTVLAVLMHGMDAGRYPSLTVQLTTGAVVFGAFFIATDPVSAPSSNRGRLIYGTGIGVLTYAIRTWGAYPDGVAFAVLLMNLLTPTIDRYTVPRIYGHER